MEEREILLRIRDGDAQAFHQLYAHYRIVVAAKLLRILRSEATAEDILQDVFMRVWEQRARLDPERPVRPYLYKVAENLAYDHYRRIASHERFTSRQLQISEPQLHQPVDEALHRNEFKHYLNRGLERLPEKCRRVFVLFALEQKSYAEIEETLGVSKSTIKNHIFQAKRVLRQFLAGFHGQ